MRRKDAAGWLFLTGGVSLLIALLVSLRPSPYRIIHRGGQIVRVNLITHDEEYWMPDRGQWITEQQWNNIP